MKDLFVLLAHVLTAVAKLLRPGGARAVVAENALLKQQLLVLNRSRQRSPNLSALDRLLFGFWASFLGPRRIQRASIILRPSTLLRFHEALRKRKYRQLYSSGRRGKPGPKGPSPELIDLIVELKRRNPGYGCWKIAQQIAKAFGIEINRDVVRRVLAKHYCPDPGDSGPSCLTFIGHMKDSLWSVDPFLIRFYSGTRLTWRGSWGSSKCISTVTAYTDHWVAIRRPRPAAKPVWSERNSTTSGGKRIAEGCSNFRAQRE